jgi:hypothetical protein
MPHGQYPEADRGKCRSCGFLSKHGTKPYGIPLPRFYEAEHSERITVSAFFRHSIGYREWVDSEPMCFLGKINLMQLVAAAHFVLAVSGLRRNKPHIPFSFEFMFRGDLECFDFAVGDLAFVE